MGEACVALGIRDAFGHMPTHVILPDEFLQN